MEIRIFNPGSGQPLPTVEWNYPEVKKWLEEGLANYKGRVYTEATINEAKKDRAGLNKLAEAIDSKRKELKAVYIQPYEAFEVQAKELTAMVKAQSAEIDAQVKAFEAARKEEKQKAVQELYAAMIGNLASLVPYERLHNPKWLNVTASMTTISTEMSRQIGKIEAGLKSIDTLGLDDDIAVHVKDVFLRNFDLAAALSEKDRIVRQRVELERLKAAQAAPVQDRKIYDAGDPDAFRKVKPGDVVQFGGPGCVAATEPLISVTFRINVTVAKLKLLGDFMKANGIRPERV